MSMLSEVANFLRTNQQPIFYIHRPALHLLGIEKYVKNFYSVMMLDTWGKGDKNTFIPTNASSAGLTQAGAVKWLLENEQVQNFIASKTPTGVIPHIVTSVNDGDVEETVAKLGYKLMSIPFTEYKRLDGKLLTTSLSEGAGLVNVPNIVTTVSDWSDLLQQAAKADLGSELVIQTDYGEAGLGTYFVKNESDFNAYAELICNRQIKIMRRVNHRSLAMDAVALSDGIITGPLLHDIIGPPEVAIHSGSSSGLEYYSDILDHGQKLQAQKIVLTYGELLREQGYRGVFEVDILHDLDTGELYFGEANPRFSGCAMVTNAVTTEIWGLPLYALHLYAYLENENVDSAVVSEVDPHPIKKIDFESLNNSWHEVGPGHEWSNLILRHIGEDVEIIEQAPKSGTYHFDQSGELTLVSEGNRWFGLNKPDNIFLLSYRKDGDIRVRGDDIATVYMRGRFQTDADGLRPKSKNLVKSLQKLYKVKTMSVIGRAKRSLARRLKAYRP